MVKTKQKTSYIAEHAGNVLHQLEPQRFLDFIYLMKRLNKSFTMPQRELVFGQLRAF